MPLSLVEQPPLFCSAYKPLSIGVASTKHPNNTTPGESGIAITSIKVADATDVTTYGAPLEVGDLFVYHSAVALALIPVGQTIKISGSNLSDYDGVWRVLKVVSDKIKVIACDDFGTAIMGTMEKYYENYTLVASLNTQAVNGLTYYDVHADSDGVFYCDPSDRIRTTFKDVFAIAATGELTSMINAETYITQQYEVVFQEAYNIPDSDGINIYTELKKTGAVLNARGFVAVNSVQPYHHINETTGAPDLLWEDDLDDYVVDGVGTYRWLTYREHGSTYDARKAQRVAIDDSAWMAILYGGAASTPDNTGYRIRKQYYQASGSSTVTFANVTLEFDSYLFDAGPTALGLPSDTVRYSIALYLGNTELIPPTWFTVDETCQQGTRFYVFSRFGAIDSYTADGGRISRGQEVERQVVRKSGMARSLRGAGDYQRRTYASEALATYEQDTRKEGIETARWIIDEMIASPDVRIQIYDGGVPAYTRILFEKDKANAGVRASKFTLAWSLGVDNQRQRR